MRYNSIPQPVSSLFRGPRGRTRAILGSMATGIPKVVLPVLRHGEKIQLAPLKAPLMHDEVVASNRLAG